MLSVFLKDVRAGALFLWIVVPLNVVAALQFSRSGGAFFWANVTCAGFGLVALSMLEWKNATEAFVHSLPVTRAMVVRGRYLTAVAIGMLTMSVAGVVAVARAIGLSTQGMPWPRWVAADIALAFVPAFAIIAAIYLPCYFRWGFGRGNVAAALVLAAGIVASDIAGRFFAGAPGVPAGLIPQGVTRLVDGFGLAAGGVIALGGAALLLWASSWLAIRACVRQEF